jgi:hypothetical protein
MTDHTTDRVLFALYCFSRDTYRIDASALARSVGLSATQAAAALVMLERAGLVDATRARLTMLGLARAVALSASGNGAPRVDLFHAQPRMPPSAADQAALPARPVAPAQPERPVMPVRPQPQPAQPQQPARPQQPAHPDQQQQIARTQQCVERVPDSATVAAEPLDPFGRLDTPSHGGH